MKAHRALQVGARALTAGVLAGLAGCGGNVGLPDGGDEEALYASFAASGDTVVAGLQEGGPLVDVMTQKLNDAINTLMQPNQDAVHEAAVDQVMEALFMSNLVVLPSQGAPEADPLVADHQAMLQQAIDALTQHVNDPLLNGGGPSAEAAWEARNFIQVFREAAVVIGQQTQNCDPLNPFGPGCVLLQANDESGVVVDDVFPGFSAQVRSPYFVGAPSATIQEQVIVPDAIANGECAVVLKEIQGVKAVIRPVLIPIWVEPWFPRATIVGFRTVWIWEFIPAEFLKTISFCNNGGFVTMNVQITTVIERSLLHFWSFPRKEYTAVP